MLNIGTLTGKYFQIEAFWTDTIADLKEIIQDKEGILKESQILIYQGKSLINDNYTLRDYNLKDGATLKLVLQMSGGPGAVGNVKKKKVCDTVILLLCKKNNELLIFEINPNDDPTQSLIPKKVFQIDNKKQNSSYSLPEDNFKNRINELENDNKKINYMPHLN
ncbi:ubiquitin-like protein, partial [Anaeromyces robustus]